MKVQSCHTYDIYIFIFVSVISYFDFLPARSWTCPVVYYNTCTRFLCYSVPGNLYQDSTAQMRFPLAHNNLTPFLSIPCATPKGITTGLRPRHLLYDDQARDQNPNVAQGHPILPGVVRCQRQPDSSAIRQFLAPNFTPSDLFLDPAVKGFTGPRPIVGQQQYGGAGLGGGCSLADIMDTPHSGSRVALSVTNLDYNISGKEWMNILYKMFSQYVKVCIFYFVFILCYAVVSGRRHRGRAVVFLLLYPVNWGTYV